MAKTKTTWKKGESGNPKGRPKQGYSVVETMKEIMSSEPEKKRAIIDKLVQLAERGSVPAIKEIINRMDGMPKQTLEVDTPERKVKEIKEYIDEQVQALDKDISLKRLRKPVRTD